MCKLSAHDSTLMDKVCGGIRLSLDFGLEFGVGVRDEVTGSISVGILCRV